MGCPLFIAVTLLVQFGSGGRQSRIQRALGESKPRRFLFPFLTIYPITFDTAAACLVPLDIRGGANNWTRKDVGTNSSNT